MIHGLASFGEQLTSVGDDLDRLLDLIARRVAEVVGEGVVITTLSDDGRHLEPGAVFHPHPEVRAFMEDVLASEPYPVTEGSGGAAVTSREPVWVAELDPNRLGENTTPHTRRFLERHPIRSLLIVPMIAFGEVVGTLGAVRIESELPFAEEDLMVLEALAERAALAIGDAKGAPRRLDVADAAAMFRHSVDGVLFTAPDGRILAANPAACSILQLTEAEICDGGRDAILVDDHATRAAIAQRALQGHVRAEVRMRRGGGEEFTAYVSSTIFTTASGEARASVIFRDISDDVRARAHQERQHRDLTLLHEVTNAINDAADPAAAIQRTLDLVGRSTGWPLGDALLVADDGCLRPSSAWLVADPHRFSWFREWRAPLALAADEGVAGRVIRRLDAVWESDLSPTDLAPEPPAEGARLRSYVGVPILVGSSARGVLEFYSDEPVPLDEGLVAVLVDLGTQLGRAFERAEAEAARRRLDDERATFVARAAHELRSPIAALVLAVALLERRAPHDRADRELVGLVADSTRHLDRLVARLLDLSRLEHGSMEIVLEHTDLSEAVGRALATSPPPEGQTVTSSVPAGVKALADELALGQILTNLLVNAYRHGGEHVAVELHHADGMVELWVSDDGAGIEPAVEATLFAPFARGSTSQGAGLGLAISSQLATAMGGSLRHERPDDGGCRFVIAVPTAP